MICYHFLKNARHNQQAVWLAKLCPEVLRFYQKLLWLELCEFTWKELVSGLAPQQHMLLCQLTLNAIMAKYHFRNLSPLSTRCYGNALLTVVWGILFLRGGNMSAWLLLCATFVIFQPYSDCGTVNLWHFQIQKLCFQMEFMHTIIMTIFLKLLYFCCSWCHIPKTVKIISLHLAGLSKCFKILLCKGGWRGQRIIVIDTTNRLSSALLCFWRHPCGRMKIVSNVMLICKVWNEQHDAPLVPVSVFKFYSSIMAWPEERNVNLAYLFMLDEKCKWIIKLCFDMFWMYRMPSSVNSIITRQN